MSLIALCAVFAAVASGCVPPDSEQFSKPVTSPAATSEPVVLNGAGGKISGSATKTEVEERAAGAAAAAVPAGCRRPVARRHARAAEAGSFRRHR